MARNSICKEVTARLCSVESNSQLKVCQEWTVTCNDLLPVSTRSLQNGGPAYIFGKSVGLAILVILLLFLKDKSSNHAVRITAILFPQRMKGGWAWSHALGPAWKSLSIGRLVLGLTS